MKNFAVLYEERGEAGFLRGDGDDHRSAERADESGNSVNLFAALGLAWLHRTGRVHIGDDIRSHPSENGVPPVSEVVGHDQLKESFRGASESLETLTDGGYYKPLVL